MTPEQENQIIGEWFFKSTKEFAEEFGVSVRTIQRWAKSIREKWPRFCPKNKTKVKMKIVNAVPAEEMLIQNYIKKYGLKKFCALGGLADKIRQYGIENFYAPGGPADKIAGRC